MGYDFDFLYLLLYILLYGLSILSDNIVSYDDVISPDVAKIEFL